ncbi:MAG: hypothetical protein VCA36_12170, partial [Opitutales bacterium]
HSEGYPVEEDWRMSWLEPERTAINAFLTSSGDICETAHSDLMRWRRNLEQWIVAKTDFVL